MANSNHGKNWRTYPNHIADEFLRLFDPYTHSISFISIEHRLIHDGMGFTFTEIWSGLAAGASRDYIIDVPAGVPAHFRKMEFDVEDGPFDFLIYEDVVTSADGTPVVFKNNNRGSAVVPSIVTTVGPTVTDVGDLIHSHRTYAAGTGPPGQLSSTGTQDIGQEWIFNPGHKYLLRLTNNSAGAVGGHSHIFYVEPSYENE